MDDKSWLDLAKDFEGLDPDNGLYLQWSYDPAAKYYECQLAWPPTSVYINSPDGSFGRIGHDNDREQGLITAKFKSLATRSGRKAGFPNDPLKSWLVQLKLISQNDAPGSSIRVNPITEVETHVITGAVNCLCLKAAELCYSLDADPNLYSVVFDAIIQQPSVAMVPARDAMREITATPAIAYPKRAQWLTERLKERAWDHNTIRGFGGPDRKTVLRVLAGKTVQPRVLESLVSSLNKKKIGARIDLLDVPSD